MKALYAASLVLMSALVGCQSELEAPSEPSKPVFTSLNGPITLLDLIRNGVGLCLGARICRGSGLCHSGQRQDG